MGTWLVSLLRRLLPDRSIWYAYRRKVRRLLNPKGYNQFRHLTTFTAEIENRTVRFATDDEFSNNWFFPRYLGGKIHEPGVAAQMVEDLRQSRCFVDVGANFGWYSCFGALHMSTGQVYGFEMDELNFDLLRKNIKLNGLVNCEVHHCAVSDRTGTVRYRRPIGVPSPGYRIASIEEEGVSDRYASVESVTLDQFFRSRDSRPDLVKIDVEGAEEGVLAGMDQILSEDRPVLYIEVHRKGLAAFGQTPDDLIARVMRYGYQLFEIEEMESEHGPRTLRDLAVGSELRQKTMVLARPITC